MFGSADIDAVFIPDKLKGKLKLRLLPDGSLRVGGGLVVQCLYEREPASGDRHVGGLIEHNQQYDSADRRSDDKGRRGGL